MSACKADYTARLQLPVSMTREYFLTLRTVFELFGLIDHFTRIGEIYYFTEKLEETILNEKNGFALPPLNIIAPPISLAKLASLDRALQKILCEIYNIPESLLELALSGTLVGTLKLYNHTELKVENFSKEFCNIIELLKSRDRKLDC